ncbi:MAG: hypothetical protein AAB470_03375 [Patescibacteria group bacterium]
MRLLLNLKEKLELSVWVIRKIMVKKQVWLTRSICVFILIIACGFVFLPGLTQATTETFDTPGSASWIAPAGVTSVIVDTWAGGGGGAPTGANTSAGGGAGGGFASTTVTVVPANSYDYYVGVGGGISGTAGEDSMFEASTTVLSKGGGAGASGPNGAGGATTTGAIGTVIYHGGNGAAGVNASYSGAGGGGAGSAGNGGVASGSTAGSGGSGGGGAGGAGRIADGSGLAGSTIGGGGSGGKKGDSGFIFGGTGARGQIVLTYITPPTVTNSAATSITFNSATLNGNITNVDPGTEHGFAYGTSTDLSVTSSTATTTAGSYSGSSSFTGNISSLICNTTYYVRAYAINISGTGFSTPIISFTTSTCPARYWYNSGADANWTTLTGNWWTDSARTLQAGALPTASDPIVTSGSTRPSVDLATWVKPLSIDASVTGITFTSATAASPGLNITGNVTFNGSSYNSNTITGTAKFSSATGGVNTLTTGMQWGSGTSTAIVGSDDAIITSWVFNNNSINNGTTTSATFNSTSYNNATSTDTITFNETSYNNRQVTGSPTFNGSSYNNTGATITGNPTFNATSYNKSGATIIGNPTFGSTSYNAGTVSGTSKFSSATGGVNTLTTGMQWGSGTSTAIVGSDDAIITSWVFNNNSINNGTTTSATFNSTSYNNATSTDTITFNETSYNNRQVTGSPTFNGSSYNNTSATITGIATFNGDSSENLGTITGVKTRRYTTATSPTRSFTASPWTVLADGAEVNLVGATFGTTTTFSTANGGFFTALSTTCSSSLLGGNLTYALSGNTTATCTIGNDNITLNGANYTLTGDVSGNGSTDGANGHIFSINYLTVTGSVTANGYTGTVNGGNGGTATITFSTTGNVSANGGNGATNGGNGGTLNISTTTSAVLSANGGNSTVCGRGGNGGTMNLADATYTSSTVDAGSDQTTLGPGLCPSPPSGSSGSSGSRVITTTPSSSSSSISSPSSNSSSGALLNINQLAALGILPLPKFNLFGDDQFGVGSSNLGNPLDNLASPGRLKLSWPTFSFINPFSSFVFAPLPDSVQKILKQNKKLASFLAGAGFNQAQDLANLALHPILLPVLEFDPPGLFIIAHDGIRLTTYLASDPKNMFVEMVETTPGTELTVSLIPPEKNTSTTGVFDGKTIDFVQNQGRITTNIIAPTMAGRYFLTTPASSLTLAIDVIAPSGTSPIPTKKQGIVGRFVSWFRGFF